MSDVMYQLAKSKQWQALLERCTTHPEEACYRHGGNNSSRTALYEAVKNKAPYDTIYAVSKMCPLAASFEDNIGRSIFHDAVMFDAEADVLLLLLDRVTPPSEALLEAVLPNALSRDLIHEYIQPFLTDDTVSPRYRQALNGCYYLRHMIDSGTSHAKIVRLINAVPHVARMSHYLFVGSSLLHQACFRGQDISVIQALIENGSSNMLMTKDRTHGCTPLHILIVGRHTFQNTKIEHMDVLRLLIKASPLALTCADKHGNLPVDTARANEPKNHMLIELLRPPNPVGTDVAESNPGASIASTAAMVGASRDNNYVGRTHHLRANRNMIAELAAQQALRRQEQMNHHQHP
mmetsp:Transcript_10821/g.16110  ORF Transcript_10821/g.16110 Transcript_10821/m.16110 type:complete len:349 (-) Transcript_10821:1868-2914(-)|eukprot:CAMPEP_0196810024 /NCGR_PEP_ID=MMETSP1362-20130617/9869_2 /TAXON_ID=163516 /ORGANISM="Leptocylindrus danicus, Strain CCMP1856" /LENGTH=348 /DNA_ID=CAMNT_0042184887 /DNA_START=308 /DNA_END=1354 /DNA_ORIENTATION=-